VRKRKIKTDEKHCFWSSTFFEFNSSLLLEYSRKSVNVAETKTHVSFIDAGKIVNFAYLNLRWCYIYDACF